MRRCYDSVLIAFSKYFSRYISHLQGLQSVDCPGITLDVDAFTHLSCVPALTQLSFTLSPALLEQITLSDPPLCFPNLRLLTSNSQFLDPVSRFLSRTQLPVIRDNRGIRFQAGSLHLLYQSSGVQCRSHHSATAIVSGGSLASHVSLRKSATRTLL